MPETWITRGQLKTLSTIFFGDEDEDIEASRKLLADIGINVEECAEVDDDSLHDTTVYRLAVAHGFYPGVSVSWLDIRDRMPWLTDEQCDALAAEAAESAGDNDLACDIRSDAIDAAVDRMEDDDPGSTWDPLNDPEPFVDKGGSTWTLMEPWNGWNRIQCSDGRVFVESGSEWELVAPTAEESVDA
jgi:hypothetical protein